MDRMILEDPRATEIRLLTVISSHFGLAIDDPKISLDTEILPDLEPDSLDTVELIMEIEDQFGIEITDDEVMGLGEGVTIRDVLALVERRVGETA